MSNKEIDKEEVLEKQNNHLDRTLKELGWIEIKQEVYRLLKINDPKDFHGYTARIRHKYYKMKPKINIIHKENGYRLKDDDKLIMTGKQLREFKELIIKEIKEKNE